MAIFFFEDKIRSEIYTIYTISMMNNLFKKCMFLLSRVELGIINLGNEFGSPRQAV